MSLAAIVAAGALMRCFAGDTLGTERALLFRQSRKNHSQDHTHSIDELLEMHSQIRGGKIV
jgi:hypothetical protein